MPRTLRVLTEGGLYQVYNRFAPGEEAFADSGQATEFLDLVRDLKQLDDPQIIVGSPLSFHLHLAVRTAAFPPKRSMSWMRSLQIHRTHDDDPAIIVGIV